MNNEVKSTNNQWNKPNKLGNEVSMYKIDGYSEENYQNHQKSNKNIKNTSNKLIIFLLSLIVVLLCVLISKNNEIKSINLNNVENQDFYAENRNDMANSTETLDNLEENIDNIEKEIFLPIVITLSTGTYKVGRDIASGIYNLTVVSGAGLISGDLQEGYLSEMMGIMEGYEEYYSKTYKNLYLKNGDEFEISSGVSIKFVPIS